MRTNKKRWACRSSLALIATLATALVAVSASAATGPPTNTSRPTVTGSPGQRQDPDRPSGGLGGHGADHVQVPVVAL